MLFADFLSIKIRWLPFYCKTFKKKYHKIRDSEMFMDWWCQHAGNEADLGAMVKQGKDLWSINTHGDCTISHGIDWRAHASSMHWQCVYDFRWDRNTDKLPGDRPEWSHTWRTLLSFYHHNTWFVYLHVTRWKMKSVATLL